MNNSKRERIRTKVWVQEKMKWENMRRLMLTSLAFVVLFCGFWGMMLLPGDHPMPRWGVWTGLVITVGVQVGFFAYGFRWMGQLHRRESTRVIQGYWLFTWLSFSVMVEQAGTKGEAMFWMMLLLVVISLVPIVPKMEFALMTGLECATILLLSFQQIVDWEHGSYLMLALGLCGIISRQSYASFESRMADGKRLSSVKNQAERDPMTGMLNRRGLENRLGAVWPMCVRQQLNVAVVMMDIDNFKKYNDSFGHPKGDQCIRSVTEMIQKSACRKTDYAARIGGEEFLVLLTGISEAEALKWCKRCKESIEELRMDQAEDNFLPFVSVSMGVCCGQPYGGPEFWELQEMADQQLYQAKKSGRACIHMGDQCYARTVPQNNKRQYFLDRGFRSLG